MIAHSALHKICLVFAASLLLTSCSTHKDKEWTPDSKLGTRVNNVAQRQLPPEPTYHRMRWGVTPENPPQKRLPVKDRRPILTPVVELVLKNNSLEQAAQILAASARYDYYAASAIADKRITLHSLGTIDELATMIEAKAGIRVIVDHQTRSVRFLEARGDNADFYDVNSVEGAAIDAEQNRAQFYDGES